MLRRVGIWAGALSLLLPATALAAPNCTQHEPHWRFLAKGAPLHEAVISDGKGRLFYSNAPTGGSGQLMRLDRPGARPKVLLDGIGSPGGMAFDSKGMLLLGFGDGILDGLLGNITPVAGLLRVNPNTGVHVTYATGLAMANGVARAPNGTVFASTDVGLGIDRVSPSRQVTNRWASVISSNGLVVDPKGRYLYAAQTFQPAAVQRIQISNPAKVKTFFTAGLADIDAGFDGMTRDSAGNLFVAANGAGQIWRIGTHGRACVLARGLTLPSAVAFGHGTRRFKGRNLYAVTFRGDLVVLPNALAARP